MTATSEQPSTKPRFRFTLRSLLLAVFFCGVVFSSWHWLVLPAREVALRYQRANSLKQIGLALWNHHDVYRSFPCACFGYDPRTQPPHSWRVCVYPYIEKSMVMDRYDFNKTWDSTANLQLSLDGYAFRPQDRSRPTETAFLAIVGPGTAFPGDRRVGMDDITDGTANTIIVAEAYNCGVHWLEPRDLHIEQMSFRINDPSRPSISGRRGQPPLVLFADGRVVRLNPAIPARTLRGLLTIAGGETIDVADLEAAGWIMPL